MSAVEYGQSVAHIVGMSESGHRSCKCGAVYDRSEHIAEVARKISSFECAVCAPPTQCASGPTHSRSSSPVHRQGGRRRGSERPHSCTVLISDTVEQELGHPETHNAAKPNDAWWRCVRSGQSSGNQLNYFQHDVCQSPGPIRVQTRHGSALVSTALPASHRDGCSSAQITNSG